MILVSVVWGFVTVIPFVLLETVNRWKYQEEFPFAVFGFMWIIQTMFVALVLSFINGMGADRPWKKVLKLFGMGLLVYMWLGWMVDQWPCFVGVPNCD